MNYWLCGNIASAPKAPFIFYSRISYFGHGCPRLNFALFSHLTGKRATQNKKTYAILVHGHVHNLWPYQEVKIKIPCFL